MLFNIMLVFTGINIFTYTIILTALEILFYLIIGKIKQKNNGNKKVKLSDVPVGYFLCIGNILVVVAVSIIKIYIR